MKTIKSQGGDYRYLLFFTNNYHEKVRVEFGTTSEIKEILKDIPILTPPVYLFKKIHSTRYTWQKRYRGHHEAHVRIEQGTNFSIKV